MCAINLIDKKISDRRLDDIKQLSNTINLKNEKEELLKHFDHAFLKLFPHFITAFNTLLLYEYDQHLQNPCKE